MTDAILSRETVGVVYGAPDAHGNTYEHPVILREGTQVQGNCRIGAHSRVNGATLYPHTHIGRFCSIARGAALGAPNHPFHGLGTSLVLNGVIADLKHPCTEISHDVWVGTNAVVMGGLKIGTGAVVGVGPVVTRDVEPYAIVAGVTARPLRKRFAENVCEELLRLAWWEFDLEQLQTLPHTDVSKCLEIIRQWRA